MKLLNYQPHRKMKYASGLISLVLLPILCLCWLYKFEISQIKYVVNVLFWSKEAQITTPESYWPESLEKKKNTFIELTGNDRKDKISLQYAQVLLSNWKAHKDDTQVLKFHFGSKAKYWAFIEAINICETMKVTAYLPYQNNIYAFWNFQPKPIQSLITPPMPCGGIISMSDDVGQLKEPIDWLTVISNLLKDYWAPGIVFLLMTILTFQKLLRRSKPLVKQSHYSG